MCSALSTEHWKRLTCRLNTMWYLVRKLDYLSGSVRVLEHEYYYDTGAIKVRCPSCWDLRSSRICDPPVIERRNFQSKDQCWPINPQLLTNGAFTEFSKVVRSSLSKTQLNCLSILRMERGWNVFYSIQSWIAACEMSMNPHLNFLTLKRIQELFPRTPTRTSTFRKYIVVLSSQNLI